MQRIVKAKTQRGKRFLQGREAKIHEDVKQAMFVKGGNTSQAVTQFLKDLYQLKKTESVMYKKKNVLRPFEDETPLEFFSHKSDASLFVYGSHSKKRPHNIVLGRMYDHHILDMVEMGLEKFVSMNEIQTSKCPLGTKPCIMFTGEQFDTEPEYKRLKNMFTDFFRGPVIKHVRMAGLEHVIMVSAIDSKIYLRSYRIQMKKSGSRIPRIELEEMGPNADLTLRRTKLASDDLYKRSLRVPKTAKPKKTKNISQDPFGSKLGRIHMQKQDLGGLQIRKMKGLKKRKSVNSVETEDSPKKSKTSDSGEEDMDT